MTAQSNRLRKPKPCTQHRTPARKQSLILRAVIAFLRRHQQLHAWHWTFSRLQPSSLRFWTRSSDSNDNSGSSRLFLSCFYLNFLFPPLLFLCLNGSRNKHYHPNDAEIFLMNTSAFKTVLIKICSARLWELYNTSKPSQENFPNSSHTAMDFWSLWHVYQKNWSLED